VGPACNSCQFTTAGVFKYGTKAEKTEGLGNLMSVFLLPLPVRQNFKEDSQCTYDVTLWQSRVMFVYLATLIT
jgi:hypothetical protein